jgi:hypothetical protein
VSNGGNLYIAPTLIDTTSLIGLFFRQDCTFAVREQEDMVKRYKKEMLTRLPDEQLTCKCGRKTTPDPPDSSLKRHLIRESDLKLMEEYRENFRHPKKFEFRMKQNYFSELDNELNLFDSDISFSFTFWTPLDLYLSDNYNTLESKALFNMIKPSYLFLYSLCLNVFNDFIKKPLQIGCYHWDDNSRRVSIASSKYKFSLGFFFLNFLNLCKSLGCLHLKPRFIRGSKFKKDILSEPILTLFSAFHYLIWNLCKVVNVSPNEMISELKCYDNITRNSWSLLFSRLNYREGMLKEGDNSKEDIQK